MFKECDGEEFDSRTWGSGGKDAPRLSGPENRTKSRFAGGDGAPILDRWSIRGSGVRRRSEELGAECRAPQRDQTGMCRSLEAHQR